jgi:hypothetical protein
MQSTRPFLRIVLTCPSELEHKDIWIEKKYFAIS